MITLYGTQFSLYTGKVRSYLIQKQIPFKEIRSTLKVYKNVIIPRTGVRYIPVIETNDSLVIQDTTDIIDHLESVYPNRPVYPKSPKQALVAMLLELYGDEWLVIPAMHYRWNFPTLNESFINGEFGRMVVPNAPRFIQRFFGEKLGRKFKGFVPGLGINEQTISAIESSYEGLLHDLNAHFTEHDYLLGAHPTIADFGFIGPLYAHLYRDPAPGALMKKNAPHVCAWVERMNCADSPHADLPKNDAIPATLTPILQRMAREHLPVLIDTNQRLNEWRKANPKAQQPDRIIGKHAFSIEGVKGERVVLPYALWMLQRSVNFYHSLDIKGDVDGFLRSVGLSELSEIELNNQLKRHNNKLVFTNANH